MGDPDPLTLRIETAFGPQMILTVPYGVDVPDWLLYLMERAGEEAHPLEQFRDWLIEGGFQEGVFPPPSTTEFRPGIRGSLAHPPEDDQ